MSFFKKIDEEYVLHIYPKGAQKSGKRRKKITRKAFMPIWKDKDSVHLSIPTPITFPKELAGKRIMIIAKRIRRKKRKPTMKKTKKKRKLQKVVVSSSFYDELFKEPEEPK